MSAGPESEVSTSLDDFYPGFLWEMAKPCFQCLGQCVSILQGAEITDVGTSHQVKERRGLRTSYSIESECGRSNSYWKRSQIL